MKKLLIFLLIIMILLAGCGKIKMETEVCGTPLAPSTLELDDPEAYIELLRTEAMSDEELTEFLREKGYAEGKITEREQVERCIELVGQAPVPLIQDKELTKIVVYPDDDWMKVNYFFEGDICFRYDLKGAEAEWRDADEIGAELGKETEHNASTMFYDAEIGGVPVELALPLMKTKEVKEFFGDIRYFFAEELWTAELGEDEVLGEGEPVRERNEFLTLEEFQNYLETGENSGSEAIENKSAETNMPEIPTYKEESILFNTNGFYYLNRDACFYKNQNIRQNYTGSLLTWYPTDAIFRREDNWIYFVYDTDTQYRLFLLASPENDHTTTMGFPIVVKEGFSIKNFSELEIGDPIEKVEAIDPVATLHKKQIAEVWDQDPKGARALASVGHPCTSIHYLNDGILKIEYEMKEDQSLVISNIVYNENYILIDALGEPVNYKIDDEHLPAGWNASTAN